MEQKTQPLELKPISLDDKPLFDQYLSAYPPSASELTFTNIFCWAGIKQHRFFEHREHLIITSGNDELLHLYPPIGPQPEEMMTKGIPELPTCCFMRIDKELAAKIHSCSKLTCDRDNSDYIYRLENLRELKGKKYDGKRNHIKRFEALQPTVETLSAEHAEACMHIQQQWLDALQGNPTATDESAAIRIAFDNFEVLKLHGVAVFVKDTLVGFAIGEPLNSSTYVEHFEKALTKYTGVYPFLLSAFVQSIPKEYIYLNREQDLGIAGIRKSKESWHPEPFLVEKFTLKVGN